MLNCPNVIKNKKLWRTLPFINGKFVDMPNIKETFDVINPVNGQIIAKLPSLGPKEVDEVSKIAMTSFDSWKFTTATERAKIIKKMADLMELHRDDLAAIVTLESGKPLTEAKGEVIYAQSFYEFYSEEIKRMSGEILQTPAKNRRIFTIKQPVGPVGLITPWNFPSAMITRKVGPALGAGCTAVLKPSEETPLSALALCAIAEEAGLPPGVLNCIPVGRENVQQVGFALSTNPHLRKISFTGSTNVGKTLMRDSGSTIKRVSFTIIISNSK
jgi:acyl-CoA reductase-like NAD-dependent aldehyde dehydrogenase